ncbi:MAG: hypothetical protein H7122_01915 [Chitinophagaceae bacterium]|nr:hypothetical protein [Chitinophagaceae bacterium]
MKKYFFTILVLMVGQLQAQDFPWWAKLVKWDGVTPWQRYIITNPAYLGINALPVPFITNGSIDSVNSIGLTGNFHFSDGDNTQNLAVYGNYCLVKDVISFDMYWVPYERYQMSHAIKEKRHVFSHYYYDKSAQGEMHLNTNIQLFQKWRNYIHLALRVGYRLPTSSGLGTARFTDAPGYYFDFSAAKPFHKESRWKLIGMAGLYVWQTNLDGRRQNDAFLFGGGVEWNPSRWRIQMYGSGYLGYMDDLGDKPVLFRTSIERKGKRINGILKFQQGLHDIEYSSVETGIRYIFKNK